jgi:hypothetical protein
MGRSQARRSDQVPKHFNWIEPQYTNYPWITQPCQSSIYVRRAYLPTRTFQGMPYSCPPWCPGYGTFSSSCSRHSCRSRRFLWRWTQPHFRSKSVYYKRLGNSRNRSRPEFRWKVTSCRGVQVKASIFVLFKWHYRQAEGWLQTKAY